MIITTSFRYTIEVEVNFFFMHAQWTTSMVHMLIRANSVLSNYFRLITFSTIFAKQYLQLYSLHNFKPAPKIFMWLDSLDVRANHVSSNFM